MQGVFTVTCGVMMNIETPHPDPETEDPADQSYLTPRKFGTFNWIGLKTLYLREVRRFMKVGMQTLLAPVVSALLFMTIFKLAFPGRGDVGGVPFGDFIAPGVVMMAILNNAFQNSSSSMTIAKVQGSVTDFLTPPMSSGELCLGFLAGAATRGLLVGVVSLIIIGLLGAADVSVQHAGAFVFYGVIGAFFMAAIGLIGGIWSDKFDHLAAVTNFILLPLTMLSGTFYPIEVFAEPFLTLSYINPFFHLIDGFRFAFTGNAEGNLLMGGAYALTFSVVLAVFGWMLLRSGYKLKA